VKVLVLNIFRTYRDFMGMYHDILSLHYNINNHHNNRKGLQYYTIMKRNIFILLGVICYLVSCNSKEETGSLSLWYNQPASGWNEALPIGNGHLGAMIFGKPGDEILQLNDNTLYSGEPSTAWKGLDITQTYDEALALLRAEKYVEATDFLLKNWLGRLHQNYQPLGDWHLVNHVEGEITGYKRELDIANAVLRIGYRQNGVSYTREIFASYPDDVIVMRLRSDKKDGLDVTTSLSSVHPTAVQKASSDGLVSMSGQAPGYAERRSLEQIEGWGFQNKHPELFNPDGSRKFDKLVLYGDEIDGKGMFFETRIKATAPKANMSVEGDKLRISGTDEIVFVLSSATSFNGFDKSPSREGANAAKIAEKVLKNAGGKKYDRLKARHTEDYRSLFNRVSFDMPVTPEQSELPTDERLVRYATVPDNGLITLLYQYGRYLMISGSRPGGQPLNLQGMWNDKVIPPWNGGYTININTEMNYWPAEPANLSECHQPLIRMIKEIAVSGTETAKNMYHRRGWVAHHNVSVWRETYPNDGGPVASYWPMAAPWLCSHLWEHYLFTGDEDFLRNDAYPLMKSASEFYADWLVDNDEGFLVTPVSTSPENAFFTKEGKRAAVSMGCTMDMSLIRELFTRTVGASKKLNMDVDFRKEVQDKLSKLLPYRIGAKGQLQEWQQDFEEPEPTHRHLSHLYGLHPGNQINNDTRPELMQAIARTLELRGDAATGWSMGWKINLWARMLDGNHANLIINNLFKPVGIDSIPSRGGGGLYLNLFDACPPFQIDGNFGYTAGVTEMLLQSHAGFIQLLPALPSGWSSGKITGLKTRGGFVADITWENGKLSKAKITSTLGGNCRLRTSLPVSIKQAQTSEAHSPNPNPLFETIDPGKPQNPSGATGKELPEKIFYTIDFMTEKGKVYEVKIKL
jgi:alpha-L-fucosidase 2